MVTFNTIIVGILAAISLVVYYATMALGWLFALPVALLLVTWLIDQSKGTNYTQSTLNFFRRFIPKRKAAVEPAVCPVCEAEDAEELPTNYKYCYACGKLQYKSH